MDAAQYKDYVLTLLFMKYVSDKHAGKSNVIIEVPKDGSFADAVKLKIVVSVVLRTWWRKGGNGFSNGGLMC